MVLDSKETTVAYRCPACGATVISVVGVFALSGDLIRLKCSCGGSEMTVARAADRRLRLTVPCLLCPRPHIYTLSSPLFFEKSLFTLTCETTGIGGCFVGGKDEVLAAAKDADEEFIAMLEEAGLDDADRLRGENGAPDRRPPDEDDMQLHDIVNFILNELRDEGKIHCRCADGAESDYAFTLCGGEGGDSGALISCRSCGASRFFPFPDVYAANAFLHVDEIVLE